MPLVHKIRSRRQQLLKVDRLRPWGPAADPLGPRSTRPIFHDHAVCAGHQVVFSQIDPAFREQFQFMMDRGTLISKVAREKRPGDIKAPYRSAVSRLFS